MRSFAARVGAWQASHGRSGLPWQDTHDPYRIWLSEVMLQQTQVAAVIPYFLRFVARFPTIKSLASANVDEVMAHWSGLGYYARARNLHRAAQIVMETFGGEFPRKPEDILRLPGVGESTANAIAAFAFGVNAPILDGNVKRVLARHAAVAGFPGEARVHVRLWDEARTRQPTRATHAQIARYTQGMMDLGSQICVRHAPQCLLCPVAEDCAARLQGLEKSLPTPRPARALPLRRVTLAVVVCNHTVLMQQRPASGIWGGLLSLPEIDGDALNWASEMLALPPAQMKASFSKSFMHAFTHFQLEICPEIIKVKAQRTLPNVPSPLRWLALADAPTAALPAPIKRFFRTHAFT